MALKMIVDSLEHLSEAQKALYAPKDGKFVLDVEGAEDTSGLKSALEAERKARRDFERKLAAYRDLDPEDYARLKREAEDRVMSQAQTKGQWEALKTQIEARHKAEIQGLEGRLSAMRAALEENLVDAASASAISQARGAVALLLPHVKSAVRVSEENGRYQVRVVDADGEPRLAPGADRPMTIADLVAEMRCSESFGRAFDGLGASGSGAPSGHGSAGPGAVSARDAKAFMANVEKIAAGKVTASME
jgi:hypothetical protein